jgi:hypothetical protein
MRIDPLTYDEIFDYGRVRNYLRCYPSIPPNTVGRHFAEAASIAKRATIPGRITAETVCAILSDKSTEHASVIKNNHAEAKYVAEYYIVWNNLPKEIRKEIQQERYLKWKEGIA